MKSPSTLLGLAIGDALGQPFEFLKPKTIIESGWEGGFINRNKKRERKPGQWTDDTKMALCIADSLIANQGFNAEDIAKRYVEWFKSGDLRGIGMRCEESIKKLAAGVHHTVAGVKDTEKTKSKLKRIGSLTPEAACGNGTLMRVAPLGLMYHNDCCSDTFKENVIVEANITHQHPDARDASLAMATMIATITNGQSVTDAIFHALDLNFESAQVPNAILQGYQLADKGTDPFEAAFVLGAAGTAHQTFGTAVYALLKEEESFHTSLVTSILMGGDTDTRAAVVGAILGTAHPEQIPKELIEQVEDSDRLRKIDYALFELGERV